MRISDWSSDVCSSDLRPLQRTGRGAPPPISLEQWEGTMRPYLTAAEVAQIELQLAGLASLLEFGCGEATIVAARQVRRIVSVESDPARLRTVQEKVAREAVDFIPVHIDIGPVGEGEIGRAHV